MKITKILKTVILSGAAVLILGFGAVWAYSDLTANALESVDTNMSEEQVQRYMHEMTHYKVTADRKWGDTPLTMTNVNNLITIVEANNYEQEDFYLKHLNEWRNGNFVGAVEVHNRIWSWNDGTVGKATGLMTEQEQIEYEEKH